MTGYRSPFVSWERSAGVRGFAWDEDAQGDEGQWLPLGYFAGTGHCSVDRAAFRGTTGAALLLGYLHFTKRLESELIGPVCSRLAAQAPSGQEELSRDAVMLQVDESFHALLCMQLSAYVSARSGLAAPAFGEPRFLRHVRELRAALAGAVPEDQVDFAAAVVAETIVTRTLAEDWRDSAVRPRVRAFLKVHHCDEARHGAFFSQALALCWRQWPDQVRAAVASAWDGLVDAFAAPDLDMIAVAMRAAGNEEDSVVEVVERLREGSKAIGAHADSRLSRRALDLAQAGAVREVAA
jgi:hypothetical protein